MSIRRSSQGVGPTGPTGPTGVTGPTGPTGPVTATLTTKGDLLGFTSINARVGVGADYDELLADAAQTTGLRYGVRAYFRREVACLVNAGAATIQMIGQVAPNSAGTAANADDADGAFIDYVTDGTTGFPCGNVSAFSRLRRDWLPEVVIQMKTAADITSVRIWVGCASSTLDNSADPATVHAAAFRYDTVSDGTAFWRTYTKDGSTATVTTTTAAIAVSTGYTMRIDFRDQANVKFYLNDVLVATHTTNLPTATTKMGWVCRLTAITAVVRHIVFGREWHSHK